MLYPIAAPSASFFDKNGDPLDNGAIYIGLPNQNPITSPVSVYWDIAATQPAAQPLKTLAGYIARAGTPAVVYCNSDYSILIQNRRGQQVAYAKNSRDFSIIQTFLDLANGDDLLKGVTIIGGAGRVVDSIAKVRQLPKSGSKQVFAAGYYAANDGGGGSYHLDASDTTSADNSGTVVVAIDGGRWKLQYTGAVSIKQFGAKGDGTSIDTTPIQRAVDWATLAKSRALYAPAGVYMIDAYITKAASGIGLNMSGDGLDSTVWSFTSATAGLVIQGGSGMLCHARITGIGFTGTNSIDSVPSYPTYNGTILVEVRGQCGQTFERCRFGKGLVGLRWHNMTAGQFTEFCVAIDCDFTSELFYSEEFKVSSGDASFNGTGIDGGTINTTPPGAGPGIVVLVDVGSKPYASPLTAQIWGNGPCTIISNNSTEFIYFIGALTLERFVGTMQLGGGNEIPYISKGLGINNQNVKFGTLFLCEMVLLPSTGGYQTLGGRYSAERAMTGTGANAISVPATMNGGLCCYGVRLSAMNYDYRYVVYTWNSASGGRAQIIATLSNYNVAGYGGAKFSIDSNQELVIVGDGTAPGDTGTGFPMSGVTAMVDVTQLSQSQDYPMVEA